MVRDEGSNNGTYVNGVRIPAGVLRLGRLRRLAPLRSRRVHRASSSSGDDVARSTEHARRRDRVPYGSGTRSGQAGQRGRAFHVETRARPARRRLRRHGRPRRRQGGLRARDKTIVEIVSGCSRRDVAPRRAPRSDRGGEPRVWSMPTDEGGLPARAPPSSRCSRTPAGAEVAHVGDSRVYLVHAGAITQVTQGSFDGPGDGRSQHHQGGGCCQASRREQDHACARDREGGRGRPSSRADRVHCRRRLRSLLGRSQRSRRRLPRSWTSPARGRPRRPPVSSSISRTRAAVTTTSPR